MKWQTGERPFSVYYKIAAATVVCCGKKEANASGIDLENQFPSHLKIAGKPLSSPVTIYFRGVAPGEYRIPGYWNSEISHKHLIEKDYWRRTAEFTLVGGIRDKRKQ